MPDIVRKRVVGPTPVRLKPSWTRCADRACTSANCRARRRLTPVLHGDLDVWPQTPGDENDLLVHRPQPRPRAGVLGVQQLGRTPRSAGRVLEDATGQGVGVAVGQGVFGLEEGHHLAVLRQAGRGHQAGPLGDRPAGRCLDVAPLARDRRLGVRHGLLRSRRPV